MESSNEADQAWNRETFVSISPNLGICSLDLFWAITPHVLYSDE